MLTVGFGKLKIKDSYYRNQRRFTLRSFSKGLIPVSVRLKFASNSRIRRAKEIIHSAEKQSLQDMMRYINGILHKNAIRLDRFRSRLFSLVNTAMRRKECTDFINKVRKSRFIEIRDRQIDKFSRLVGYKERDREIIAQSLVSSSQI